MTGRAGGTRAGPPASALTGRTNIPRWEFGDLEPGEYTLHIPGLMLTAVLPQDVRIPVAKGEQQVLELPGASLEMQISGEFPPAIASGLSEGGTGARFFVSFALAGREDLTLEGLTLSAGTELPAPESFVGGWSSCRVLTDDAGAFAGLDVEFAREAMSASPFLTTGSGNTFTCWWEHPFELKIQVPS